MSLLSKQDVAKYLLGHGRIFESVCDEPNCGKLIRPGELCIVLKWQKKEKDSPYYESKKPSKVRCMDCENYLHPRATVEVKVKAAGRGAKKVTAEVASTIQIHPIIRKAVLNIIKAEEGGVEKGLLIGKLMKKKAIRELPKKVISQTLRGMRKLKMFKGKGTKFVLPKEKKQKIRKAQHV